MIKTFNVFDKNQMKTGRIESQPGEKKSFQNLDSNIENQKLNELQGLEDDSTADTLKSVEPISVSEIGQKLPNPNLILSSTKIKSSKNNITHSFDQKQSLSLLHSDNFSLSTKIFDFYENFTGITHDRPEIIMLTDFKPIFRVEKIKNSFANTNIVYPSLTDTGIFFNTQLNIRQLKSNNIKHIFSFNTKKSNKFNSLINDKKTNFLNCINEVSTTVSFLANTIGALDGLSNQFDLRNKAHVVDPKLSFKEFVSGFSQIKSENIQKYLTDDVYKNFSEKYDIADILNKFGFSKAHVNENFTNTKKILQTLLEFKYLLGSHSLSLFDIKSLQHNSDKSPAKLIKSIGIKRFKINKPSQELLSLKEIFFLKEDRLKDTKSSILNFYKEIYENINFKNEEIRISALVNSLSKELKYSLALDDLDTRNDISSKFNYTFSNDNSNLFDFILGYFGDNIADMSTNSLANNTISSICQIKEGNSLILPFENKQIEDETGALKSGDDVYIQSITNLQGPNFNTLKIKEFLEKLILIEKSFNFVANKLNFLSLPVYDDNSYNDGQQKSNIENPIKFYNFLLEDLVDNGKPSAILRDDPVVVIFSAARQDETLRALLFLYLLSTNEATKSSLNNEINSYLKESFKYASLNQAKNLSQTSDVIKTIKINSFELDKSFYIKKIKEKLFKIPFFGQVLQNLSTNQTSVFRSQAQNKKITSFGGHSDTVIAMMFFDLIIAITTKHSNKKLSGVTSSEGIDNFVIQVNKIPDESSSYLEITSRLKHEISLIQHVTLLIFNSFKRIRSAINNVISKLESESMQKQLNSLLVVFNNNFNLVNLVFDKQQLEIILTHLNDINSNLKLNKNAEEIQIFDEFTIGQNVKNVLEKIFSLPQYSSNYSDNQKILSVGVPLGFLKSLKKKVDILNAKKISGDNQQNDIIKIKLFKSDIKNPDIIYYPKEFLFELSRFPVRDDSFIKQLPTGISSNIDEIVKLVPTRNHQNLFEHEVQYISPQENEIAAMNTADYSFLSQKNKLSIHKNHVLSYALEWYLKVLSGVSTSDYDFCLLKDDQKFDAGFFETTTKHHLSNFIEVKSLRTSSNTSDKFKQVLFNKKPFNKQSNVYSTLEALTHYDNSAFKQNEPKQIKNSIAALNQKDLTNLSYQFSVLNEGFRSVTNISSENSIYKSVLSPKQFDRVFNIVFDPYTFEINEDLTNSTNHGRTALQLMINKGEIEIQNTSAQAAQKLFYRKRGKSQGDLLFEKYFITIETFEKEEN
jgi:hypothetical protein